MFRKETFVFVLMFTASLAHTRKRKVTWTLDQTLNDVIKVRGYPHIDEAAHSVIHCASLCTSNSSCFSFFFHPKAKECFLNELVFTQPDGGESSPGSRYYKKAVSGCPFANGYVWLREPRMCIKAYREGKDYKYANLICSRDGSRLVVLDTETKKNAVEKYFGNGTKKWRAYVGAAREGVLNATKATRWDNNRHPLYWLNGVKVPTKEVKSWWAKNNPSNTQGREACMEITSGGWNDLVCSKVIAYICEKVLN